ncbi:MAG: TOBE domain-containing protein [Moraxellaceae bacterium]|nr:TOBE domain-containing protein [Moraxellaceae bacterium]
MNDKSRSTRLVGRLEVATDLGNFLGGTRIRLLEAIAEHGSISQAAPHVPLSYKAAWDAVDAMNNLADQPLVERVSSGRQGGGTQLTDYGRRIVALYRAVEVEYQSALDRLSAELAGTEAGSVADFQRLLRRMALRTSARNQFACTVVGLRGGDVEYEVQLRLDDRSELIAIVTRESAERLGLAIGTTVVALVKASSVLLADADARVGVSNRLQGSVSRIVEGPVNVEVTLDIGQGKSVVAVVTRESQRVLGIVEGTPLCALFSASNVILNVVD